jgi:hypothetical protein
MEFLLLQCLLRWLPASTGEAALLRNTCRTCTKGTPRVTGHHAASQGAAVCSCVLLCSDRLTCGSPSAGSLLQLDAYSCS